MMLIQTLERIVGNRERPNFSRTNFIDKSELYCGLECYLCLCANRRIISTSRYNFDKEYNIQTLTDKVVHGVFQSHTFILGNKSVTEGLSMFNVPLLIKKDHT